MKTVYGVKKKVLDDLLQSFAYNPTIFSFCKENKDLIYKKLSCFLYSIREEESFGCCEVNIDCFPLSIIDKMLKNECNKEEVKTFFQKYKCNDPTIIPKLEDSFESDIEKLNDSFDRKNRIRRIPNVAFVYLNDNLKEIGIGIPSRIETALSLRQTYECRNCGSRTKVRNDEIPNFMYRIGKYGIEYYCSKCAKDEKNLVHVGDFSNSSIY